MNDTKREKLIEDLKTSLATIATERDALRKLMEQIEEMLDPIEAGIGALEEAVDAFSERL